MTYHNLSKSQLLIWTGQKLSPQSPLYNMAFKFEFRNEIDPYSFQLAFNKLVQETDALRSCFVYVNNEPKVVFKDSLNYDFKYLEMGQEVVDDFLRDLTQKVFDLNQCLFETALIKHDVNHYTWYINQHHLITDGWALTLLYNRMMEIYLVLDSDKPKSYESYLSNYKAATQFDFWTKLLNRSENPLSLFNKDNESRSANSERFTYTLKADQVLQLKHLLKEPELRTWSIDLGMFNFFITILSISIFRFNKQKKLAIGVPALNRNTKSEKSTIGLFIEMFPVLTEVSNEDSYLSLYKKVNISANAFLKNAKTGTSTAELNKAFHFVLNYINARFSDYEGISMKSEWLHPSANDPGHHLSLQVTNFDGDEALKLSFDFNLEISNGLNRSQFIELFLTEIDQFLGNQNALIYPEAEKERQVIEAVNQTDEDFPTHLTVLDLFAENLPSTKNDLAIVSENESITFGELDLRSNQLAQLLIKKGITKGFAVGIKMERSIELMIGLLGIIKSGAAYVPIDPNYPQDRIDFMIDDASIPFVVDLEMVLLSNSESVAAPESLPNSEDLMYIIYTSGSTGKPKGVMNEHGGVLNRLCWAHKEFALTKEDAILQKTNYTFDVSVGELFLPLLTGSRLVMARPNGHRDSDYLKEVIEKEKITSIHFVPPMLEIFLMGIKKGDCPSLRYVSCTGEVLKKTTVIDCMKLLPQAQIYNLYGPTEAAVEVTMWKSPAILEDVEEVTIGKPFSNVKIRIVDPQDRDCGILTEGELLIGGIQVARGYKNRAELTEEKFFNYNGLRWYRTGDLCQWLPSGEIEFKGRMDTQVKVRGFRVELSEIEQVARELPEVLKCVALHKESKILLFVQIKKAVDVKAHLVRKLPDYMIPSVIKVVEEIPYLNNGKIDRQSLLSLSLDQVIEHHPENEFQEFVHQVWSETLGHQNIDIKSNFFNLGGHSLSGIRVITHINSELDLELPVVLIFSKPTIEELAEEIEAEIDKRMSEA